MWQLEKLTPVQALVGQLYGFSQADEVALSGSLFRGAVADYSATLVGEARAAGYDVGYASITDSTVLQKLQARADFAAASIAHSYNLDVAKQIERIAADVPTANRWTYSKRLEAWDRERMASKVESIAVTEMGNCLHRDAAVTLADGSKAGVAELVASRFDGDVMTIESGNLARAKVVGWHRSPLGQRNWVGLSYKYARTYGRGKRVLWLTDDHQVLTPDGWTAAGKLKEGDLVVTEEPSGSPFHEEIVAGTLLGDGFLRFIGRRNSSGSALGMVHAPKQREWLTLKAQALESLGVRLKRDPAGKVAALSQTTGWWLSLRSRWYPEGRKIVDREMVEARCGPLMLATWFLDDGDQGKNGDCHFATHGFGKSDVEWLAEFLTKMGYPAGARSAAGSWRLSLTVAASRLLVRDIAPYVPPSMRYKLREARHQGLRSFDPDLWAGRPAQPFIDAVEIRRHRTPREKTAYCLDVEGTRQFFASGLAVHNSMHEARRDFFERNPGLGGVARVIPMTAAEPLCQALVDRGEMAVQEGLKLQLPVHVNCIHVLEIAWACELATEKRWVIRKVTTDCPPLSQLWLGSPVDLELTPSAERAWTGARQVLQTKLTRQETGALGERIALSYLRQRGFVDAAALNLRRPNFPVDLVGDHHAFEIKAGLVSNGRSAQQWRATLGEPGVAERKWLSGASPAERASWNAAKQEAVLERKRRALQALSNEYGRPVTGRTVTMIIDPDRRVVDVFEFEDFHLRKGWADVQPMGSYRYG